LATTPDTATDTPSGALPPHDEFYAELTTRNRGLVTTEEQERLRTATILVAGCGSIGGAAVEPLIRIGCEHLVLAEPDGYDIANMNRQSVRLQDVGRNKAEVFKQRMGEINPYATVDVHAHGITEDNVRPLVEAADVILDGVDVTTKAPIKHKYNLHREAKRLGRPVVSGYDIAGLQLLYVYDYRDPGTEIMHGKIKADEVERLQPFEFLARIIPVPAIPIEMIPELRKQLAGESEGFPQLVYTAHLFGVLAVRAVLDILAGRPIRKRVIVDADKLMRPTRYKLRLEARRWRDLAQLNREARGFRRSASAGED
jgi:molybdopterin/thiamine biosynthesis adenylyltransferase